MYQDQGADVVVIGGGHAGCEAALAAARLGFSTILFAISLDSIAQMPCNPSIGGTSKGHLVREVDALGGEMGKNIDKTYIQSRMLNTAKGPAVHSLRAQADKFRYKEEMKRTLERTPNLRVRQNEIVRVDVETDPDDLSERRVIGVETATGAYYPCKRAIICTGTYLNARCIHGEYETFTGPNGSQAARGGLTENLASLGLPLRRFKTGTPARVDGKTLDLDEMTVQNGDPKVVPFSFENTSEEIAREQIPCYLTYTNEETHTVIRQNLHRSPLYGGVIHGVGPRYCPSIEDKVVRFADKERHQLFLEPEGENTLEYYVQGMSSSLPEDVQRDMLRTIPGMHHVEIMRTGYAIEYDCIDPLYLKNTLEIKTIQGLYSAGQFNGSSGYEEAAAQGLIAGLNAVLSLQGKEPVKVDRTNSYIGVLIDDLVTKGTNEPYRMMTSRAEYRLMLRQDNADLRLTEEGHRVGLIPEERYQKFLQKKQMIDQEEARLKVTRGIDEDGHSHGMLSELLKHPEHTYLSLAAWDKERPSLPEEVWQQAEIRIKYEGYIARELQQIEHFHKLEKRQIPADLDYAKIEGLRLEARQKLANIRPTSVGQASRISGVSPADINVLLVYLARLPKEGKQDE
ncbi:MAG: tRNA uridine-5-carboxymethylaminomethyl(34) synthesis enzyme MnmG [Firmicutes bacterium]|nr:tRNA uridine-5-carboxymethylaminomethyl(34) synthesis enzyme MnmG [Bacillota bacterium]